MPNDHEAIYIELKVRADNAANSVYVRSDQVPGLHILGKCMSDMKPLVEDAIVRLYRDNKKINVRVIWLSDQTDSDEPAGAIQELQRVAVYKQAA